MSEKKLLFFSILTLVLFIYGAIRLVEAEDMAKKYNEAFRKADRAHTDALRAKRHYEREIKFRRILK